jgi:hypothetical protein
MWGENDKKAPQDIDWGLTDEKAPEDSGALGLAKAGLTGFGKSVLGLATMAANPGGQGIGIVRPDTFNPSSTEHMPWHKAQGSGEELAERAGSLLPAMAGGPGGIASRAITNVAVPAIGGQIGKELARGTPYEPYAEIGGMVGGGIAASGGRALLDKARSYNVTPHREQALGVLKSEGITPTAGQATGNSKLARKEAQRGGAAYEAALEKQSSELNAAAFKKVGLAVDRITPGVANTYLDDIGTKFDDMAATSTSMITRNHGIKATRIAEDYKTNVEGTAAPIVENIAKSFQTDGRKQLTGETYKALRTEIDRAARGAGSPNMKEALYAMRGLLDDTVESAIDPAIKGAWRETRRQYKNWLSLEKAIDPTTGRVTPASLQRAAISVDKKRSYLRGRSDYTELANAADLILQKPPSTGTTENAAARMTGVLGGASLRGGIGYGLGAATGIPLGGEMGGALGVALPAIRNRMMMTPRHQNQLRNRITSSPLPWLPQPPYSLDSLAPPLLPRAQE